MDNKQLEEQTEFLLSAALHKCGNLHDAQDLTQDTLLAALVYRASGKTIDDLRGWLLAVLNNKWNDRLRKKYRLPVVGIGEGYDVAVEDEALARIGETDEGERVRKAVAFLGKLHREVIVRHYLQGQSVEQIAHDLHLPPGTVKRRLHDGRERMKKGLAQMERYTEQSYHPITLQLTHSGNWGRNQEPCSLISKDLLAQNILYAAYQTPLTAEEIAASVGIPAAYVEPVLEKLTDGELMKKKGNKFHTDFMITTLAEQEKHIPAQKEFAKAQFERFWTPIREGLDKLREQEFYTRLNADQKNSLELYFAFYCLDYGIFDLVCDIFGSRLQFPYRKDGGCWIAYGTVHIKPFDPMEHIPLMAHAYSGQRFTYYENFAGSKLLRQHTYSAEGFPNYSYNRSPDYTFIKSGDDVDDIVTRLLYILHMGISPESVGFDTEYLRMIPHLTKCKILRDEDGKPRVNIPVLSEGEFAVLSSLLEEAKTAMVGDKALQEALRTFLADKGVTLPAHLENIHPQKQFSYGCNAMLFATVRLAMEKNELYNGNYDDDSGDTVNQHPCPMFLVVE